LGEKLKTKVNMITKAVRNVFTNKRYKDYDYDYYYNIYWKHANAWYGPIIKLYYRHIAYYGMAMPAGISKSRKVLDIGCGIGTLVQQFNRLGYKTIGVDVNKAAIKNSITKGCFLVKTTSKLPYPDNHFDLIVSREVLEHIPASEIDSCIKEWSRVGKGSMVHIIAVSESGSRAKKDPTHINVKPEKWWEQKFKKHEFNVIKNPSKLFFSHFGGRGYFMMKKIKKEVNLKNSRRHKHF